MTRTRLIEAMVPMRDGVRLATDVYCPPEGEGPWPVLLERTPYGKQGTNHADRSLADPVPSPKSAIAARFAVAGYAYVLQDCRGRFQSEGRFTKYLNEGPDGADTLAWLLQQPWCNGQIGTLGLSYGAHVQTAMAACDPPGLSAMFLDSGGFSSAFHSGIRQGGAFELKQLTWALKHARLAPETAADPERSAALAAVDIREWVSALPWQEGRSPLVSAPDYEAYVLELWRRECFDSFWRQPAFYAIGHHDRFPDVPMVFMSSWYDPYAVTAIENFTGLSTGRKGPVRLILGPWTHGQRSVTFSGEVDFGAEAPLDGNLAADYLVLRQAFFDHHMKASRTDPLPHPVSYFRMGGGPGTRTPEGRLLHGGVWKSAATWPPPGVRPETLWLGEAGRLSVEPPGRPGSVSWRHDPFDPVPTVGGATASGAPLMQAGAFDQRERADQFAHHRPGRPLADRADVIIFESAPLDEPLEVSGSLEALLHVASSAPDTDITLKLVDVHPPSPDWPEGFAMNLAHGILRLRFRNGFDAPRLLQPGAIEPVRLRCFPTSNLFLRGHRIRLEVASSNFPHFDINSGTGQPAGAQCLPVCVTNRIHWSPDHPSHIVLPVVREGRA